MIIVSVPIIIKETIAKIWPFGKWDVEWKSSKGKTLNRDILLLKEEAVDWYFRFVESSLALKNVRLVKKGGFLDGIRIKPRKRRR